eukprot:212185_1
MSRMPSYRSSTLSLSLSFSFILLSLVSPPTHVGDVVHIIYVIYVAICIHKHNYTGKDKDLHPRIIPWLNWYIDILTELPMHEMIFVHVW